MKRLWLTGFTLAALLVSLYVFSVPKVDNPALEELVSSHESAVQELRLVPQEQNALPLLLVLFDDEYWHSVELLPSSTLQETVSETQELPAPRAEELRQLLRRAAACPYSFWEPTIEPEGPTVAFDELLNIFEWATVQAAKDWSHGRRMMALH